MEEVSVNVERDEFLAMARSVLVAIRDSGEVECMDTTSECLGKYGIKLSEELQRRGLCVDRMDLTESVEYAKRYTLGYGIFADLADKLRSDKTLREIQLVNDVVRLNYSFTDDWLCSGDNQLSFKYTRANIDTLAIAATGKRLSDVGHGRVKRFTFEGIKYVVDSRMRLCVSMVREGETSENDKRASAVLDAVLNTELLSDTGFTFKLSEVLSDKDGQHDKLIQVILEALE